MSEEQLKAFLEQVKADSNLMNQLKSASSADQVAALAKEKGYEVSPKAVNELNANELEGISGGLLSGGIDNTACD